MNQSTFILLFFLPNCFFSILAVNLRSFESQEIVEGQVPEENAKPQIQVPPLTVENPLEDPAIGENPVDQIRKKSNMGSNVGSYNTQAQNNVQGNGWNNGYFGSNNIQGKNNIQGNDWNNGWNAGQYGWNMAQNWGAPGPNPDGWYNQPGGGWGWNGAWPNWPWSPNWPMTALAFIPKNKKVQHKLSFEQLKSVLADICHILEDLTTMFQGKQEKHEKQPTNPWSPEMGSPEMGTPATGTPAMGTPVMGTPVMGTPVMGTPVIGTPAMGTPAMGTPMMGNPVMGTPAMGTPMMGNPAMVTPMTAAPMMAAPLSPMAAAARAQQSASMAFAVAQMFPSELTQRSAEEARKAANEAQSMVESSSAVR